MQEPIHYRTIVELGRAIRSGELSAATITEHFLDRIDKLEQNLGVLRIGHAWQQSTDWHRRRPALDRLG